MASKNHALDGPIAAAAMAEFLEKGFTKASLRKIAAAAGVTVGAIYTRYPTKDSLFCALTQPLVQRIEETFAALRAAYYAGDPADPSALMSTARQENDIILHLLFDDGDRAVLLLCRSGGSSRETFLEEIIHRKIQETQAYFDSVGLHPETRAVELVLRSQFSLYAQLIGGGCGLEEARRVLRALTVYHEGGWQALLADARQTQEQERAT